MPNVGAQVERRNFNSLYPGLNLPKAKKRGPANLGRQSDLEYAKQNQQREAEYNKQSMTGIDQAHANSLSQPNRLSGFDQQLEAQKQLKQNKADTNSSSNTSEKVAGEKTGGTNKKAYQKPAGKELSGLKRLGALGKLATGGATDSGISVVNRWWIKAVLTTSFDITGLLGVPSILYLILHKFILAKMNKASKIFLPLTAKEKLLFWLSLMMWTLIVLFIILLIMIVLSIIDKLRLDEIVSAASNPAQAVVDAAYGVAGGNAVGNSYAQVYVPVVSEVLDYFGINFFGTY